MDGFAIDARAPADASLAMSNTASVAERIAGANYAESHPPKAPLFVVVTKLFSAWFLEL